MPERSHAARPSHDRLHGRPHPGVYAQLGSVAHERDDVAAARWRVRVYDTLSPEQFVCVDESTANRKVLNRKRGVSKKGKRAKSKKHFFHRGKAYSVLGAFTLSDGFASVAVVEGGFDAERFMTALRQKVVCAHVPSAHVCQCALVHALLTRTCCVRLCETCVQFPLLQPYPEERSVLVLDNCPIHKKKMVVDEVLALNAIVLFLTPYDPNAMPIEVGFRALKGWVRGEQAWAATVPLPVALRVAAAAVSPRAARNAFHECGYI